MDVQEIILLFGRNSDRTKQALLNMLLYGPPFQRIFRHPEIIEELLKFDDLTEEQEEIIRRRQEYHKYYIQNQLDSLSVYFQMFDKDIQQ